MKTKTIVLERFLLSNYVFNSDDENENYSKYAIVKIFEPYNSPGEIIIGYGKKNIKNIKFPVASQDSDSKNIDIIINTFNRLHTQGYELISSCGASNKDNGQCIYIETYIFVKTK